MFLKTSGVDLDGHGARAPRTKRAEPEAGLAHHLWQVLVPLGFPRCFQQLIGRCKAFTGRYCGRRAKQASTRGRRAHVTDSCGVPAGLANGAQVQPPQVLVCQGAAGSPTPT